MTGQQFCRASHTLTVQRIWSWSADDATVAKLVGTGLTIYDGDLVRDRYQISNIPTIGPVAVSPTGQLVVAKIKANGADAVGVWDVGVGRQVTIIVTGDCSQLALAAADRTLVTMGDGVLRLWDLATELARGHWELPKTATTMIVTLDGRRAITKLADGTGLI